MSEQELPRSRPCASLPGFLSSRPRSLAEVGVGDAPLGLEAASMLGGGLRQPENERLLRRGFEFEKGARSLSTQSKDRTGLRWWSRFCQYVGLDDEWLMYDMEDPSQRAFVKNLARMFLTLVSEQDTKGRPRQGTAIMGKTPQRYLAVVIAAHAELEIDISFLASLAKKWSTGFELDNMRINGVRPKRHKAGITRQLLFDMFAQMDKKYEPRLKCVVRAAMMCAFTDELRRAEFLRKTGTFNPNLHLSRDHVSFYDSGWTLVAPTERNLRRLVASGGWMLFRPPTLKNDPRGEFWGDSPTPFPIGTCRKKQGAFIDFAIRQIELEIASPLIDQKLRAMTPMFVDPRTGLQMTARVFDIMLMELLQEAYRGKGLSASLDEIRKMYGIHSFRVGGDNAHRAANTPKHIRKRIGHWRSDVIEDYSRSQLEAMSACVENQDVDCPLLQVCDPAMPTYPETKGMSLPGECIINDHSCLEDPEEGIIGVKARASSLKGSRTLPDRVGRKVRKQFGSLGTFSGKVVSQDSRWYRVLFDDGDKADYTFNEINQFMV